MAEAIGIDRLADRVKIYATDLDEEALATARQAIYPARELESIPPGLAEKYFVPVSNHFTLHRDLRKAVIFGRHDIVKDAPISKINLIACRNLLIYLSTETQAAVLPRLHYALVDRGHLFLGKAETQLARSKLFEPVDLKSRIFRKLAQEWKRSSAGGLMMANENGMGKLSPQTRLVEDLIDLSTTAYLVINAEGQIVFVNATARRLFDITEAEMGVPFQDLAISYRPTELRSRIEEVVRSGRSMRLDNVEFQRSTGDFSRIAIDIMPLYSAQSRHYATALAFHDTTRQFQLQIELEKAQESLETTIEELQSSNEELETTNEELQSTNEELETTNEELQSANEELETINEELHSSNEELQAANEELRASTEAASEYRRYSESVLRSINAGIIVLDSHLNVSSWNRWSENVWGLRSDEVIGAPFATLDLGLPVQKLRADINAVLTEDSRAVVRELEAIDRRGRHTVCRVTISPLVFEGDRIHGVVVIVEDVSERRRAEEMSNHLGRLVSIAANQFYVLNADTFRFSIVNQGAEQKLGYSVGALRQLTLLDLMPEIRTEKFAAMIEPLRKLDREEIVFEAKLQRRDGSLFPAELCLQLLAKETPPVFICMVHDTSGRTTAP